MGQSYVHEFAACGGTIGRSLECDWPFPDSKRYVSSRHALIDYHGGAYYLVDLSRNGTFINGSDTPVGKGKPQRLFDGDIIRIGEFVIAASVSEDECDDDGLGDSIIRAQMVHEDDSDELTMLPPDRIHNANFLDDALKPADDSGELSALREAQPGYEEKLQKSVILSEATDEFLRAAGLNPDDFRGIEPDILLRNAGRLLSEFASGAHALLEGKQRIMNSLRIRDRGAEGNLNPLSHSDGLDNALRLLLGSSGGSDVHVGGSRAVEAAFNELLRHQQAVVKAMRDALGDFVENFEPEQIERLFDEHKVRAGTVKSRQAFLEAYSSAFAWLDKRDKDKIPRRFDDEFARAYHEATEPKGFATVFGDDSK